MHLEPLRIIVDSLLFILIWVIQLGVYPTFLRLVKKDQIRWHFIYTLSISFIISPLILLQFGILSYEWFQIQNPLTFTRLLLSAIVIVSTILLLAPQHLKILVFGPDQKTFTKINKRNWIRTVTWSTSLALSLITI